MQDYAFGTDLSDFDTPILCIDAEILESNIHKMSEFLKEHGVAWRPHAKCHKTPQIAQLQLAAGAIGITCAKVSEAQVMAEAGIEDILIANMIVGRPKWERLAEVCRIAKPIVACDHFAQVEPLSQVCVVKGVTCRVVVEVNIGLDRVGTQPGRDAVQLAEAVTKLPGLDFAGIMGYEGHLLQLLDLDEKQAKISKAMGILVDCRDRILEAGIDCPIVSAGGTGSYQQTAHCKGITEIQAGGGIFADPFYRHRCGVRGLKYSLSVLTTVVSRPEKNRAIVDAGRKSHSPDLHRPVVKDIPGAKVDRVSAEHCQVDLVADAQDLKIGDKLELVPGYADFTNVLHDRFYVFRNRKLEAIWPIAARGKIL